MERMNSLEKMIAVLDLFEGPVKAWSPEAMADRLGLTRSTLYRYLKVLADAELLTSLPGVGFTLGPRIAELDLQMRQSDPLILASRPVMAELAADIPGIALLCRRYRDRVLCVHQERGVADFVSTYERGLARPLLRGAASRIILAHLPSPMVRRLYEAQPAEFAAAGLGDDLAAVRATLREIRQRGHDVTAGDVTPGVTGVAAPLFDGRGAIVGSLSLTIGDPGPAADRVAAVADRVGFGARIVTRTLSRSAEIIASQDAT
jgi:DNA-binding IclR family transcriptional regulator